MTTIKDVAQKSGVTVTTVSRVLNNRGYISDATRQKVYQTMEELNYRPNEIARSLFRRKSNIIGLIIPTVAHPFFSEISSHIEYYAYEAGYKILLCNSHLDKAKEKEYIDMLKRNMVDGIIMGSHTIEVDDYVNTNFPLVTIDRCISNETPYISSDNFQGGKLATSLLIDKGCKKIAHISGNLNLNLLANKRYEAFIVEVNNKNIEHVTIQTDLNVFDSNQYEKLIFKLFEEHPDIDGVFSSSDILAANVIKVCYDTKRRIPDDVKIVGYDDTMIASLLLPQLTTISQPIEAIGRLAIELIIKQINGEKVESKNILPVKLIERATT